MKKWCHLPTGFKRRDLLQFVAVASIIVAVITTIIAGHAANAAPGTNKTISFQGRLSSATGAVVPDGYYNIQFKIYQDGTGQSANNPGGTLKWTETYVNSGSNQGVPVKNGYFAVTLGSKTAFGTDVDWNQDTLWLSMNIAGSAADCLTFGTGTCAADGEMLPMKQMTAVAQAINSAQLGGKTAENFVQLAQGVQEDTSVNTPSIFINKVGSGDLLRLQNTGSDVLTINQSGNITMGSAFDHTIEIAQADANQSGKQLAVTAGSGGVGSGSAGGNLVLQGGNAGGTNGNGGNTFIDAGSSTGTGNEGIVYIGSIQTGGVVIGDNDNAKYQYIGIGTTDVAGGGNTVEIGSGAGASYGNTSIRAKDEVALQTNGVDRAVFDNNGNLTLGNGTSSNAPSDFRIQGTASSASGVSGGNLTIQGGGATTGNANGGNLTLSGGGGSGTGAKGLVVIDTPTYATAGVQSSAASTGVTQANIDSFGVITLNATADNVNFTLGAPSLGASATGRIIYVTAANGSHAFTLRANVGGGTGVEQSVPMKQNTTATMIWNGSLWTVAGAGGSTLQSAYDTSAQGGGQASITLTNSTSPDGLVVRDSSTDSVNNTLLQVQNSNAANVFSVNSGVTDYANNGGLESTEHEGAWGVTDPSVTIERTTDRTHVATGQAALRVAASQAYTAIYNHPATALSPNTTYKISLSARLDASSDPFTDFTILHYLNSGSTDSPCGEAFTLTSTEWKSITCTFTTPASGLSTNDVIFLGQYSSGNHVYYLDNFSITRTDDAAVPNVQVGGGSTGGPATLFKLDKSAAAPTTTNNNNALLGSMYYDTTLGKVQCYEADGWGACGAAPDTFVTLSPEYTNAVMYGSDTGTLTNGLCSDTLNINDGSSSQPTICGTNETYNLYKWTSNSSSDQTRSIFVTYQLPSTFKKFVNGALSLMARTDGSNATVNYQVYRNNSSGLTACGSTVDVSTGSQSTWQKGTANGVSDPAGCHFASGDSVVVRINMTAKDDANAYVSNLNFTYANE